MVAYVTCFLFVLPFEAVLTSRHKDGCYLQDEFLPARHGCVLECLDDRYVRVLELGVFTDQHYVYLISYVIIPTHTTGNKTGPYLIQKKLQVKKI